MWPIERMVLFSMLEKDKEAIIEKFYKSGIRDTYVIFCKISKSKISKKEYFIIYNKFFLILQSSALLPKVTKYSIVDWIKKRKNNYHFVYATGGQEQETRYVLKSLELDTIFDLKNSLNKNNYRFSKSTGLPFKKIKSKFADCFIITDSQSDCKGAKLAGIKFLKI